MPQIEAQTDPGRLQQAKKIRGLIMDGMTARPMTEAELVSHEWRDGHQDMIEHGDVPHRWWPARDLANTNHPHFAGGGRYVDEMFRINRALNLRGPQALSGRAIGMNDDRGETSNSDLRKLIDIFNSKHAKIALDIAPGLFIAQELIKATSKLVERDRVQTSARMTFPIFNAGTWFTQWYYQRIETSSSNISEYSDPESPPHRGPRATVYRSQVPRPLVFHDACADWHITTLNRIAEARANGFPGSINFEARVLQEARTMLLNRENILTFFGDPAVNISGILSENNGIPRWAAPAQLGAPGGTAEDDYNLVVDLVKQIISRTTNVERPNRLAFGTDGWLHINTRIYETDGTGGQKTVAQMILQAIEPLGIESIMWLPELGYRAEEETAWINAGRTPAEAEAWAGGINRQDVMLCWRSAPETGEMIVGKDIAAFPDDVMVRGRTSIMMTMSSGGFEAYKPKAFALVTNIGPDTVFTVGNPVIDENDPPA